MKKLLLVIIALLIVLLPACAEQGQLVDPPRDYLAEISGEFTSKLEDRVFFDNQVYTFEEYFELRDNGEPTPHYVYVSIEYNDKFVCTCGDADGSNLSHDDELKEYFKTLNESIIADLGLTDSYDISYSEYGVAIQYRYYLYDDFTKSDYPKLVEKNPSYVSAIRIGSAY